MKQKNLLIATACLILGAAFVGAQASPQRGGDSPEVEYLRRLIAAQQANPDKIIRSLPDAPPPVAPSASATNRTSPEPAKAPAAKAPTPVSARENATNAPATDEAARQKKISDVETRLDEMIKQKEAREKAALTNAAPVTNNVPATPQTKRQRLDALLKQMIDGQISGEEYNQKRTKILAEPD